jgi:hypothetical protein
MQGCHALGLILSGLKNTAKYELIQLQQNASQLLLILSNSIHLYNENTLHIVIEVMGALVDHAKGSLDVNCCKAILDLVFHIWESFSSDIFVVEVSRELLRSALKYTEHTFNIVIETRLATFALLLEKYDASPVSQSLALIMADVANHHFIQQSSSSNGIQVLLSLLNAFMSAIANVMHCLEECLESLLLVLSSAESCRLLLQHVHEDSTHAFLQSLYLFVYSNLDHVKSSSSNFVNATVGLFAHLVFDFSPYFAEEDLVKLMYKYVEVMQSTEVIGSRKSLLFGLIYLFARCPNTIINLLWKLFSGMDKSEPNPFVFIYQQWSELHITLVHSKYNLSISSLGLIELIEAFNTNETNYSYASHACGLILKTISRLIDDSVCTVGPTSLC